MSIPHDPAIPSAASPPGFAEAGRIADAIRHAVLRAADPAAAVERCWPGHAVSKRRIWLLAVGKAASAMAMRGAALVRRDPSAHLAGHLVITTPQSGPSQTMDAVVADHPLPTERNLVAAQRVEAFAREAAADDPSRSLLLVLLSGGGSALLTAPAPGLDLRDLRRATDALLRAGAPIGELNAVRKHCERLKGGGLARILGGRTSVRCLVVSDVLGDRLDVIASGPLAADPSTYADALAVLERRGLTAALPAVARHLRAGAAGDLPETVKPGDPVLTPIESRIISSNELAVVAARESLLHAGIARVKAVCGVEGEAAEVGRRLAAEAIAYAAEPASPTPAAVVYGGETTVSVGAAGGVGGRSQELALSAALALDGSRHAAVFTLATDGVDGPTDAAGALVTSETAARARAQGLDLAQSLASHDSHTALGSLGCLTRTGPTGTNVNDIAVAVAW